MYIIYSISRESLGFDIFYQQVLKSVTFDHMRVYFAICFSRVVSQGVSDANDQGKLAKVCLNWRG